MNNFLFRTNFFMKENKYYTHVNFFLPFAYVMILGFFFTESTEQVSVDLVLNMLKASLILKVIVVCSGLDLYEISCCVLFSKYDRTKVIHRQNICSPLSFSTLSFSHSSEI